MIKSFRYTIFFLFLSGNVFCQEKIEIALGWDYNLVVNNFVFKPGHLSLDQFSKAINKKHKVIKKRRFGDREITYCFKETGLALKPVNSKEIGDDCSILEILYRKKGKKDYGGLFSIFGKQISNEITFDSLYYDSHFKDLIYNNDKDPTNPNKTLLHLRFPGYSIRFVFDPIEFKIQNVEIRSIFYDPKYKKSDRL